VDNELLVMMMRMVEGEGESVVRDNPDKDILALIKQDR
jgi:hypothetical protein